MAKSVPHKCSYKGCKHPDELIQNGEGVKVSTKYYHEGCYKQTEYIRMVRELYVSKVSNTVVMSFLNKVINSIVFDKGVEPEFLYFALNDALNHRQTIRSPATLHYLIDNSRIKKRFADEQIRKHNEELSKKTKMSVIVEDSFDFTSRTPNNVPQRRGFGDIISRGELNE